MSVGLPLRRRNSSNRSASIADNLPPPQTSKPLKPVSPPLSNTRLNRLIYFLILLTALLSAYYSYRVVQFKTEVGGWWNFALGRRPLQMRMDQDQVPPLSNFRKGRAAAPKNDEESIEDRISTLAQALGMPSKDLASAIAVAVREYGSPASISSLVAKESGTAVHAMLQRATSVENAQSTGVVGGIVGGIDKFVGLEEPV